MAWFFGVFRRFTGRAPFFFLIDKRSLVNLAFFFFDDSLRLSARVSASQFVFQLLCPCFSSCLCSCICPCISSCFCSCTANLLGSRDHVTPKRLAAARAAARAEARAEARADTRAAARAAFDYFNRGRTILLAPLVKPARVL